VGLVTPVSTATIQNGRFWTSMQGANELARRAFVPQSAGAVRATILNSDYTQLNPTRGGDDMMAIRLYMMPQAQIKGVKVKSERCLFLR
jgi:hypothetical protein